MLAGIFYGSMYGGSTTSILVNIPGEAAPVITCLHGYQMARQGSSGRALYHRINKKKSTIPIPSFRAQRQDTNHPDSWYTLLCGLLAGS
jgi:hypothetical protein